MSDIDNIEIIVLDFLSKLFEDPESRIEMYIHYSKEYLKKAFEYLERNELSQASEKGWGAAVLAVKAWAEKYGLKHFRHRDLEEVINKIWRELKDFEIIKLWSLALRLHSNFYENFMDKELIEKHLQAIEEFIEKVLRTLR